MNRQGLLRVLLIAGTIGVGSAHVPSAEAGLGDRLKKKVSEKGAQKAEEKADQALDTTKGEGEQATPVESSSQPGAADVTKDAAGGKVSSVSTKFDFVPGDSVIFWDDFTQDELGEFPARWTLAIGTFEVAEMEGQRWLRCTSDDGTIRMKMPNVKTLPEFWTLEFDFYLTEPTGSALTVRGLGPRGDLAWEGTFPEGDALAFRSGEIFSSTPFEGTLEGRHHVMLMARGKALKMYLDRQRMANMPEIAAEGGPPSILELRLWASTQPMITNVRFAEGCRPAKDLLAKGKLVTHGIHFATGSDVVLPESAPILRQVAAYLQANPTVRLKITGHTDNVGSAKSNLDLSKRRAASVARVLVAEFVVASGRFETDGKGDTQAMASNAKPEGRAMNRRVEFAKL